jgi:hypothetical protein
MRTTSEPTAHQPAAAPSASPVDAHAAPVTETKASSGKATAAMVLGILGVLVALFVPIVGIIMGVIAIVFGRQAREETASGRKSGRGKAQAGFVLGIVAVVLSVIAMIVNAAIIAS